MKSLWYWMIKIKNGLLSWSGITCLSLIFFSLSITYFYYYIANIQMNWVECRWFTERWRNGIMGFGTFNVLIFHLLRIRNNIQRQLLLVYLAEIVMVYTVIEGVNFHKIHFPYNFLLSIDGAVGAGTIMILISGIRHDMLE